MTKNDNNTFMHNEFNTDNFSPSCERNKEVILEHLSPYFTEANSVLEIGSYSLQHALHFAAKHPQLEWQPSDQLIHQKALLRNLLSFPQKNIRSPIVIDVSDSSSWPCKPYDIVFTANTLHIMSFEHVKQLFANVPHRMTNNALLCVYGPFKYQGKYTSSSNEGFQQWLQERDKNSGIRDFEAVNQLALNAGLVLEKDISMPANNQLIIWKTQHDR
ncbi:DUF938 domain-containing protein [Thalassotalea crassostreae]|uniref:DUF938 domain-containing protein n=1 Tax=Thalassotalea crassostreae TaxID=1763536 RepID=UPI000AA7FA97|nr:DUF938 domain-containing protein [Thalassotalea crassostreae]